MKKALLSLTFLLFVSLTAFAQTDKIVGKWKTIDDADGTAKSIVYIFKATNGKFYGKIDTLFKNDNPLCTECKGADKDKPKLGLMIIKSMVEKDGSLTGGTITDPVTGKIYKCNISLDAKSGNLNVRGSLDKNGWIGRSQTWLPVK